jgi:hypothetical protein
MRRGPIRYDDGMPGEDIRVPTVPVGVRFLLTDGASVAATIHLSSTSPFHDGAETLDEFFNARRLFLPVHGSDGRPLLVGRAAIVTATAPASAPLVSRLPGRVPGAIYFVKLHLENGAVAEGTLLASLPPESSRVSDAFNQEEEFVPIEAEESVVFVRKGRIARIEF